MKKARRRFNLTGIAKSASVQQPARLFVPHTFAHKVEFISDNLPMVHMMRDVFSHMWHFVDIAEQEVGWLGTVELLPCGDFLIKEVFLLEQEVSAAQTEISEEGIAKLAQELIETRKDGTEAVNAIRFWGHSHVQMGTEPSGQDEAQMRHFRQNGCPWFVRGILNKRGRMQFDIFMWDAGVKIVDVPWAIYEDLVNQGHRAEIEADFNAKVTVKPPAIPRYPRYVPGGLYPWTQGITPLNSGSESVDVIGESDIFDTGDSDVG